MYRDTNEHQATEKRVLYQLLFQLYDAVMLSHNRATGRQNKEIKQK
ncbi:MAG: hypothetical protein AAF934_11645 [Bacteroidota bacterium]